MKRFNEYLAEDFDPAIYNHDGGISIDDPTVVDAINSNLEVTTANVFRTPYNALEDVRKVLEYYKIFLPKAIFLDQNHGNDVFEISQFGEKTGMNDQGEVVTANDSPLFVYFEWSLGENGMYDVFASVVNEDELEEIMADFDAEVEDDETDLQEQTSIADHTKYLYRIVNKAKAEQHRNDVEKFEDDNQVNEEAMPNLKQKMASPMRKRSVTLAKRMQSEGSTWGVKDPQRKKGQYASEDGKHVVKIHKKNDEYVVSLHTDGKHYEPADYFTNDKDDAHSTAKAMLNHAQTVKEESAADARWKKAKKFARIGKRVKTLVDAGNLKGAKKTANKMKKVMSESEQLDEVSPEWLRKKAGKGFDIFRTTRDRKKANKKLKQMEKIMRYAAKKEKESPTQPSFSEPTDELQKRYNELNYKGD